MRHLQHVHMHYCLLLWRTPPLGIHHAEAVFNQRFLCLCWVVPIVLTCFLDNGEGNGEYSSAVFGRINTDLSSM